MDAVRAYWNRRPCNIRHSQKPVGTREYFDEVERRKYFVEPHIPRFAQFERWRGKKVLEIGCGIGTDAVNFAKVGAELTTVDYSDKSLELCRKRFDVYGLGAAFCCANAEELSRFLPVAPYDLIYSFGVIHHTSDPAKVFAEIEKYCHPQTEVRVMLYSKWSWKTFWIIMKYGQGRFWRAGELIRTYSEAQTGCPITGYYSFRDVERLMSGFHIISIEKDHVFPFVIDKYVKYEYEYEWYFCWMPRMFFRWLERRLGWHTLIVAKPKT